eukprot:CAMPEP_0167773150 /NCGR_PEP_ID=MMETSP0111_2-20121227/1258_1 /TAXON_ID=91324 /ORGANISM="Lotharella globosa, Strain CCCM811" /LENGTH=302 /DNA_ID=CAMNT_0007662751 /DNA_START=138 /DNA_END=1046 /DNA_ORIENTATION=+
MPVSKPMLQTIDAKRALNLKKNPLPKLFILGEQKCGTTSMFWTLSKHPEVCDNIMLEGETSQKELRFFSKLNSTEEKIRALPHYLQHFANCSSTQLRIDATPGYLSRTWTAQSIKDVYRHYGQDLSELRFIVMLRDPTQRVISAYEHFVTRGRWPTRFTLEDALQRGMDEYTDWEQSSSPGELYSIPVELFEDHGELLGRGLYEHSIRPWFKQFAPSQFKILSLKQFLQDTPGVIADIHEFLGLTPLHQQMREENIGNYTKPPLPKGLREFYEPHIDAVFRLKNEFAGSFYETPENPFSLDM